MMARSYWAADFTAELTASIKITVSIEPKHSSIIALTRMDDKFNL